jgi:hypothetical protein
MELPARGPALQLLVLTSCGFSKWSELLWPTPLALNSAEAKKWRSCADPHRVSHKLSRELFDLSGGQAQNEPGPVQLAARRLLRSRKYVFFLGKTLFFLEKTVFFLEFFLAPSAAAGCAAACARSAGPGKKGGKATSNARATSTHPAGLVALLPETW